MITTSVRLPHFKKILLTEGKLINYLGKFLTDFVGETYPMQNSFSDKIKSLLIKVFYLDFVKKVTDAIVTRGVL